jgi:hypothetical protein
MAARLLLSLLFVALLAPPSLAGDLDGAWVFAGEPADLEGREAAIKAAADSFPALFRSMAYKRLEPNAIRPDRYIVQDKGAKLVMRVDHGPARETDLVGTPITFKPAGRSDDVTLARERQGDAVHSTVISGKGRLETHLERVGERLKVTITVSSERLDTPIQYSLTYRRE